MNEPRAGYPPYNPEAECPKCGHESVATRYFVSREGWEGLHRCCERCGYGWNEATVESRPKSKYRD